MPLLQISENTLSTIFNCNIKSDYDNFKQNINYPLQKDISVNVALPSGDFTCLFNQPNEVDDVYVLTWTDYLLSQNGNNELVVVNLRVW